MAKFNFVWWFLGRRAIVLWWLQRVFVCRWGGHIWWPAMNRGVHVFDRCQRCRLDRPTVQGMRLWPERWGSRRSKPVVVTESGNATDDRDEARAMLLSITAEAMLAYQENELDERLCEEDDA